MRGRHGQRFMRLTCLILAFPLLFLGCERVDAQDDSQSADGVFTWSGVSEDVVLEVSRQSGSTRGRRIFTLYGSGELRMERYTSNFGRKLEERSLWLSDDEIRSLLKGSVASHLPQWTGEELTVPEIRRQIPITADTPYLRVHISLTHYPPLGSAIEHDAGFPVESTRDIAPILETFDEVTAAWKLESTLREMWKKAGAGS